MTATENIVNVYFSAMHRFCWYCWAFLRYGSTVRIQWTKITIFNRYERKYLANGILTWPWLLLTINRKLHIVDLLYPDGFVIHALLSRAYLSVNYRLSCIL